MIIITPLNKNILVEPESKEEITKGGIIIPDIANQKAPTKGRVIAIAEDSGINLKVQPGDVILFSKYSGTEITLAAREPGQKDRKLLLLKDENVLAIIEEQL